MPMQNEKVTQVIQEHLQHALKHALESPQNDRLQTLRSLFCKIDPKQTETSTTIAPPLHTNLFLESHDHTRDWKDIVLRKPVQDAAAEPSLAALKRRLEKAYPNKQDATEATTLLYPALLETLEKDCCKDRPDELWFLAQMRAYHEKLLVYLARELQCKDKTTAVRRAKENIARIEREISAEYKEAKQKAEDAIRQEENCLAKKDFFTSRSPFEAKAGLVCGIAAPFVGIGLILLLTTVKVLSPAAAVYLPLVLAGAGLAMFGVLTMLVLAFLIVFVTPMIQKRFEQRDQLFDQRRRDAVEKIPATSHEKETELLAARELSLTLQADENLKQLTELEDELKQLWAQASYGKPQIAAVNAADNSASNVSRP